MLMTWRAISASDMSVASGADAAIALSRATLEDRSLLGRISRMPSSTLFSVRSPVPSDRLNAAPAMLRAIARWWFCDATNDYLSAG